MILNAETRKFDCLKSRSDNKHYTKEANNDYSTKLLVENDRIRLKCNVHYEQKHVK